MKYLASLKVFICDLRIGLSDSKIVLVEPQQDFTLYNLNGTQSLWSSSLINDVN